MSTIKKKIIIYFSVIFIFSFITYPITNNNITRYINQNHSKKLSFVSTSTSLYDITMKQDILCLMLAYPNYIDTIEKNEEGFVYLKMKSGKKIRYDDKRDKSNSEKISTPDIQDMMETMYPLNAVKNLMEKDYDPGRSRVYQLLHDVYGNNKKDIEKNLSSVKVGYKSYPFNTNNKAGDSLNKAMKELAVLAQKKSNIQSFLYPCSGTYNYRYISGTNRLSPHSFGIAIDFARDERDYWKWASRKEGKKRIENYPSEIVQILEANNFIWGGKWGHFDILHFEYRPEIIIKAKYFSKKNINSSSWYSDILDKKPEAKEYIDEIEKII